MASLLVAAPVWLYQLWAFIAPGLHRKEKKYALTTVAVGTPLRPGGPARLLAAAAGRAHPALLLSIEGSVNQITLDDMVTMNIKLTLAFGLAFQLPRAAGPAERRRRAERPPHAQLVARHGHGHRRVLRHGDAHRPAVDVRPRRPHDGPLLRRGRLRSSTTGAATPAAVPSSPTTRHPSSTHPVGNFEPTERAAPQLPHQSTGDTAQGQPPPTATTTPPDATPGSSAVRHGGGGGRPRPNKRRAECQCCRAGLDSTMTDDSHQRKRIAAARRRAAEQATALHAFPRSLPT